MSNLSTLSEQIRNCKSGVINNPYQGKDKKVLFVCTMGILRSATAARMYARKYNTRAAGTASDALVPITETLIQWADQIVFVNRENYLLAKIKFPDLISMQNVLTLDIPDEYEHMHPKLVKAFEQQYEAI
jgi:protein-tyrosine phosphatase